MAGRVDTPPGRCVGYGLATVAAIAVVCPMAAQAQSAYGAPPEGIQVQAILDEVHDSNVARSAGTILSGKRSDERVTPTLNVTVNKALGRNSLTLSGFAGYDFYRRNKQLNRERLGLNADLGLVGGPCFLHLRPGFSRMQSDLGDIIPISAEGVTDRRSVRNVATTQSYGAEVQCGSASGFRPLATFEHTAGNNSEVRRRIANYRTNTYGGGLAYGDPIYGEATLRFTQTDTSYPDRPAIFGPANFSTKRITFDYQRSIGAVLTGSAGISYVMVRPDNGVATRDFNGFGWHAELSAVPTPDMHLQLGTSRDISPSLGNDATYQINRGYNATADYAFSGRLRASLTGSIRTVRYFGSQGLFGPPLTDSRNHTISPSLSFLPTDRLTFTLYGGYQDRKTNNTLYDYHSYFIGLRTSFTL
ncbi:outer membrane beta-barrel protein [Sphingomonas sp.]|uniref:outer membrane beta-barrel protein n=1 Tax=Sphingomonas sp. TaxID=28214 RepID=UPI00257CE134|nr:outer membrane beta-barrel protein [Sphingomonas sp.]